MRNALSVCVCVCVCVCTCTYTLQGYELAGGGRGGQVHEVSGTQFQQRFDVDVCMYEEEDTCMSDENEEEDTCQH